MPLKVSSLLATVTGSRRRTGAPRSQRGTRLKATTDRAFLVSAGFPTAGAGYRRGLFIIAGRAERDLPIPIQGSIAGVEPTLVGASPSRAGGDSTPASSGGSP